jgi:histone-lysine N-methyltransferase SETMAR
MSSTYFTDNIVTKIAAAFFPDGKREQSPTLTLHLENCSLQRSRMAENFMEQNAMESMPHPPYSPDLTPSDFFSFPLVKKRLDQFERDDPDDLLEAITEVLISLQGGDLYRVFQESVDRVRVLAEGDGGDMPH